MSLGSFFKISALTLFFALLSYLYLSPASHQIFSNNTQILISDGTDMTTLPFHYWTVEKTLKTTPADLLYGAVHTDQLNPPIGASLWVTWIERIFVAVMHRWIPVEVMPIWIAWILLIFNALAFFWMGRMLGWNDGISIALAVAWAFNPFTIARASVHLAMCGVYFIPLWITGLTICVRATQFRPLLLAACCLVLSLMGHVYFIVSTVAFSFFWVAWIWIEVINSPTGTSRFRLTPYRMMVIAAPLIFVLWNFSNPLPPRWMDTAPEPPVVAVEAFMNTFAAHPLDYFSSDIKLSAEDWNPLREKINRQVLENLGSGNPHERTNGIRWVVWLCVILSILQWFCPKVRAYTQIEKRRMIFFLGLALMGFWFSLSPNSLEFAGIRWSPFLILQSFLHQLRVPARFGLYVQFSCLVITGIYLNLIWPVLLQNLRKLKPLQKSAPFVLGALASLVMILDNPPVHAQKTDVVYPAFSREETQGENCGTGLFFPYMSGFSKELVVYYRAVQSLRGTQCKIINLPENSVRNMKLLALFSTDRFLFSKEAPTEATLLTEQLVHYVQCMGLDWIYFRKEVSDSHWRESVCKKMGWEMVSNRICRKTRTSPEPEFIWKEECFPKEE